MAVVVREGTITVHDKVLGAQEVLQILWMIPYDLCDMVQLYLFHVVCVENVLQRKRGEENKLDVLFQMFTYIVSCK